MKLMKKGKKRDYKYPRAVKAVTLFMVLVSVAMVGISTYVSVASGYLTSNLVTTLTGMNWASSFGYSATTTSAKAWMVVPINNTGSVGLDINNLAVDVKLTYDANGTTLEALTFVGSLPFGESRLVNITIIDATPSLAMGLNSSSITMAISFAMRVTLPRSWGIFAFTISDLKFGLTVPMPGGLQIS
jgi:hypothetical protein